MFRELGGILYPWPLACMNCGQPDDGTDALCGECRTQLTAQAAIYGFARDGFGMSVAAHEYAGPAGALVRALKYRTLKALAKDMARDMIGAARNAGMEKPDVVAYVPMHWRRRQSRYINQAQVLAEMVAREWGAPSDRALKRVRACRQQARIGDMQQRMENVRDAFAARRDLRGLRVALVDDVYTTGATARECARAMRAAGARSVDLIVYSLARTGGDDDGMPF